MLSGEELVALVPGLQEYSSIDIVDYAHVLSSQYSVHQVYGLARLVRQMLEQDPELTGVVVTHGTGTMEESAFMLDLACDDPRPIVFTGAMRPESAPFSDGPHNLRDAVRVAGDPSARGKGVLLVMNGFILTARDAHKSHTTHAGTFDSVEFGPLGYVYPDRVHFARAPLLRRHIFTENPVFDVDLIKYAVGMDGRFIAASVAAGAQGIVIEGSGLGNLNDALISEIDKAISRGIIVAVCSRSPYGRTFAQYETHVGAAALRQRGCILASLSGPKTRILLMLALGQTREPTELGRLLDPA